MSFLHLGGLGRPFGPMVAGLALAAGIGMASAQQDTPAVTMDMFETDHRAPLVLNETEKNYVLWEMREMLVAVQGIIEGLSNEDMERVSNAATVMGTHAADQVPAVTVAKLPLQFREWATETHEDFDAISIAARSGESPDMLTFRLSGMLNTCLACHATYRIEVE
jgi:cytochrome c556